MTTETKISFDSAWAGNADGANSSHTYSHGEITNFQPPRLVRFEDAAEFVKNAVSNSDFTLVASDQPTLVPSLDGIRPVERVAGSIVNAIKGGVLLNITHEDLKPFHF